MDKEESNKVAADMWAFMIVAAIVFFLLGIAFQLWPPPNGDLWPDLSHEGVLGD